MLWVHGLLVDCLKHNFLYKSQIKREQCLLVIIVCLKDDGETFGSLLLLWGGSYGILFHRCLWFGGLGLSKGAFVLHVAFEREEMATNLRVIIFAISSSVRFSFCFLVLYLCTWSLCSFVPCSYVYFTNKNDEIWRNVKKTQFGLFLWLYTWK